MIKARSLAFLLLMLSHAATAQLKVTKVCFLANEDKKIDWSCLSQKPTKEDTLAGNIVNDLVKPLGLRTKFLMRECDEVQNFAALVAERTQARYIVYSKAMMDSISDQKVRHWDQIAIYLHELAHHLNGNTANPDDTNTLQQELDADEFSGRRMAQLKATLGQAQHYLSLIENPGCDEDSIYGHPCLAKRLDAVARGWYDQNGQTVFYLAMLGKTGFSGLVTSKEIAPEQHLQRERFFESDHCIRSFEHQCRVSLNEVRLEIGIKESVAKLTFKLTDWANAVHRQLDTTITYQKTSKAGMNLLPGDKISLEFPAYEYNQSFRFEGTISSSGQIKGQLISPNEHGASWAPDPTARPNQFIAALILHPD